MNQIARCDWLPEWARWSARDYPLYPVSKISPKPYNKSFIDQARGQDGWILASFFFCEFMDLAKKHAKKELGQYPAILTSRLVNNPYVPNPSQSHQSVPDVVPVRVECCVIKRSLFSMCVHGVSKVLKTSNIRFTTNVRCCGKCVPSG